MSCAINRWPPVYDFDTLQEQIKELLAKGLDEGFYKDTHNNDEFFQGDLISLESGFPYIDENGDIVAEENNIWLILGNTCDIAREDLYYTNIVPLDILENDVPIDIINKLKSFQNYKRMFFPDTSKASQGYIADFTKICTIEKQFLIKNATKINELEFHSWVLFHSCIIRYFARDDGRND